MHEYSIVQALLETCETYVKENKAEKVSKLVVKIGVLSGVEPDLLQRAFDTFKEKTICEDAIFELNIQKVVIKCLDCGTTSTLNKHEFFCPKCDSNMLDVLDGEEMYLMSLVLD